MTSKKRVFLVFLGAPGAGKGTQTRILAKKIGLPQISTGDLFRESIKKGTELGRLVQQYTDFGNLVPDDVTIRMVKRRLAKPDCASGAILDGFPRNLVQVTALDEILAADGGVTLVPMLTISDAEVMRRITGRRVCRICGDGYHIDFHPPARAGVCDRDGGELYLRDDDTTETVKNRLYVYYKQTSPLVGYYYAKKLLAQIDGLQKPEEVTENLLAVLAEHGIG